MKDKQLKLITFRATEKTYNKLKIKSDNEFRTVSQVINIILEEQLKGVKTK